MGHGFGRVLATIALGALALPACIGVSQTPYAGDPATAAASGKLTRCPGFAVPAVDGLIDEFEDGNGQVMTMGERDGYWWVSKDALGTTVTSPEEGFKPAEGGAAGSAMAAHVKGHVVANDLRHQVVADTLTHLAHHRGQMTVYLRLLEAKVASTYGPSADDNPWAPPKGAGA